MARDELELTQILLSARQSGPKFNLRREQSVCERAGEAIEREREAWSADVVRDPQICLHVE